MAFEPQEKRDAAPPAPNTPAKGRWAWAGIAIVLILGSVFLYRTRARSQAASKNPPGPPPVSVSVTPVQTSDVPFYLTELGSVTAINTVTIKTRVDGQIVRVNFKEGQFVKEGDLLIEIDPRPFQVALEQASGQLAKDQAAQ